MPRIIVQKSSGTWWKVLLGFLGGTVFGIGAVAGTVAVAGGVFKTKEIIGMTGQDPNKILTEKYQEKTILEIILDATGGKIKIETLGDIADITPAIDTYISNLSEQLNDLGTELTKEEIYSWPLTKLSDNMIESVKEVELISFLSKDRTDDPDPIVKYLCYETDDEGEFVLDDEGHLINLRLKDLMDNSSFLQTKIDSMKIKMLFSEEEIEASSMLKAIKDKTVKELGQDGALSDVKIADVVSSSSDSKIIAAFRRDGTTIGNMDESINNFYLDDVFEYSDYDSLPSVLKKLLAKDSYGTFPGNLITTNPFSIKRMEFGSDGYPIEYGYVRFSDGSEEHITDYIPFDDFMNKESITISDSLTPSYSGSVSRDENATDISINVYKPSSWSQIYAFSCNKPAKVKDLDSEIDSLKLKDVMKIKPSDSLWKIRNEPVKDGDSLFESIKNNLYLEDILPDYSTTKLLKTLDGKTKISDIGDAINDMKIIEAFEDNIYDASGNLNKTWKYLLIEPGETWINGSPKKDTNPFEGYKCEDYTIGGEGDKGMDQLISNMKSNMNSLIIRQLYEDEIMDLDPDFVEKDIPAIYVPYIPATAVARGATKYGDLTILEFSAMINDATI